MTDAAALNLAREQRVDPSALMLRAVVGGAPYAAVAAQFGLAISTVERRVKVWRCACCRAPAPTG